MDEDNENGIKEPEIKLPVREVNEKIRTAIDKQLEKNKTSEKSKLDENFNNIVEEKNEKEKIKFNNEKELIEKTKDNATIQKEILEETKNSYQELKNKIDDEKRDREIRLEEIKTRDEEKNPNVKGALLKDLSVTAVVLALIIGVGIFFAGNAIIALAVILVGTILAIISMGISEEIKLLQLIYDLLYFQRYEKKRK